MANRNKDVRRGIKIYLDGKEVENNARAIQAEMRKLKKEIDGMTVGSEEYVAATRKYQQLNSILQEHRANLKGIGDQTEENAKSSGNWLKGGIAKFNEYSVAILGVTAALTGVAMKLQDFRRKGSEKESSAANLKALTGLDDGSIEWLKTQAESISTAMDETGLRVKASSREILEAYTLVGSNKPELLAVKEDLNAVTMEAMRLSAAANMELKPAAEGLTLAMNQYGAAASEASRYVNVLAAGSKFGAAGVEAQTASITKAGVAAAVAKVPIEELVGSIETLAEKGIKGEIAGTGLKTFFLKLEGMADDCRPSVVGLQTALENLRAKQMSVSEMQKAFGLEAYTVAQAMISGADSVKKYTDSVTGTNTALEQAAINSDTTEAKMAQLRNQIQETGMALAKDLAPVFSTMTNWTGKFVMLLPPLVKWVKEYGVELVVVLSTLALYSSYTAMATKAQAAWNAVVTLGRTQLLTFKAAMDAYRLAVVGAGNAQATMSAAMKGSNIVVNAAVVTVGLLRTAYYALTLQTAAAARSFGAVKAALAESGVGLAVLAVGALTAAIVRHREKMKELARQNREALEAEKQLYREYDEAKAKVKALHRVVTDNNASIEERRKAIGKLQEMAPEYLASISKEGKLIGDNTVALDRYLERLKESIMYEAYKSKLVELYKQQADAEEAAADASKEYWAVAQQNSIQGYKRTGLMARLSRTLGLESEDRLRKTKVEAEKNLAEVNAKIDETEARRAELAKKLGMDDKPSGSGNPPEQTETPKEGSPDGNDKNKKDKKETERIKQETEAINTEYKRRESLLKEDYARGVKDRETYNREMESLEIERIQKVLQISGLEPEKVAELENRIRDFAVKAREALAGIEYAPKNLTLYERYEEETVKLETELRKQKAVLEENLTLGNMDREQYNDAVTQLDEKFVRDQDALWQQYVEDMVKSGDEMVSATDDKMERLEQTMREAGVSIKDLTMEIGKAIGQGLVDAVNSDIDGVKDVFKTLLKVIIDAVEKMLIAAEVESSLLTLSGIGTAAGLANLAKLAAITALFEGLKAMVDGWASGGYTTMGDWREPAGIVHKGEFVASHEAVKNPEVKQVLDVIDEAQKRGTVGSLRGEDITEATRRVNVKQGTVDVPEMPDGGDVTRRVNVKQGTVDVPEMPDGGDVTRHVNVKQGTVDVPKIAAAEDVTRRVNVKQGMVDVPEMPDGGDVTRRVNVKQGTVDVPKIAAAEDVTRRVNVKQGTVDVPEMPDGGDVTRRVNVKQGTVDVPEMPDGGDVTRRVNVKQGTVDVPEVLIPAEMAVAETIRRVIKDAQWTGSVANLAPSDIAATATRMERTMERVTPTSARHEIQQPPVYDYSELTETLQELKARLDEPIVAETYATGKGGTMTAAALVEKMMSNASRPRRK